jgi:carbonic anhydrase/acetyltransferase-like protein (isoleucine patch superfamily)
MRHLILSLGDAFCAKNLGPFLRNFGMKLDRFGVVLAKYEYVESFNRSTRNVPTEAAVPDLG